MVYVDALIVFVEVCLFYAAALGALWLVTRALGYVEMFVRGQPLHPAEAEPRQRAAPGGQGHTPGLPSA